MPRIDWNSPEVVIIVIGLLGVLFIAILFLIYYANKNNVCCKSQRQRQRTARVQEAVQQAHRDRTERALAPTSAPERQQVELDEITIHTDEECSICYESMNGNSTLNRLPCKHTFHGQCLNNWFTTQQSRVGTYGCPMCRDNKPQSVLSIKVKPIVAWNE